MASLSLPSIPGGGKPASRLPGARGPPQSPGHGRRVWVVGARPMVLSPTGVPSVIETCSRAWHHVSTGPGMCLTCGCYTMVLSPEGL